MYIHYIKIRTYIIQKDVCKDIIEREMWTFACVICVSEGGRHLPRDDQLLAQRGGDIFIHYIDIDGCEDIIEREM